MIWTLIRDSSYLVFLVWMAFFVAFISIPRYRWIASRSYDPTRRNEGGKEFQVFFRAHFRTSGAAKTIGFCISGVFSAMLLNLVVANIVGMTSTVSRLTQLVVLFTDLASIPLVYVALFRMRRTILADVLMDP